MISVWTFNATIHAPLHEVKEVMMNFREGQYTALAAPLLVAGKGRVKITFDKVHYVAEFEDGHREYISVDADRNFVAVQGEWWYRGEYTFTADGHVTQARLEVFNLADQEWLVSLMNINAERKHELAFLSLCKMAERKSA